VTLALDRKMGNKYGNQNISRSALTVGSVLKFAPERLCRSATMTSKNAEGASKDFGRVS